MTEEFKFTNSNYSRIFPKSPMNFATLSSKPGSQSKQTREPGTFRTIRYLLINDIIHILKKGIKENRSPNQKSKKIWQAFLNNDIQKYLDNQHEASTNET